ncbi:MAG: hypothetical protein WAS33_21640 [Candidatus Promineifilaceae bacterium]
MNEKDTNFHRFYPRNPRPISREGNHETREKHVVLPGFSGIGSMSPRQQLTDSPDHARNDGNKIGPFGVIKMKVGTVRPFIL